VKIPFSDRGAIGQPFWASEPSVPVSVLLIDDDKDDAILTRSMLSRVKDVEYSLDWVPTYSDGLASITRGDHDAFLIDQGLGGRTGIELVREARETGSLAPLVMLTGRRDRATDMAAMSAGATDFLMKGKTDAALLDRTLRYAIAQSSMAAALKRSRDQVSGLEEIGRILVDEGPTPSAVQRVVDLIADRFYLPRVAIYLADSDRLQLAGQRGHEDPQRTVSRTDGAVERVARARQPLFVPSLTPESIDGVGGPGVATELSAPLLVAGELMGLLNVASFVADPIGEAEYSVIRVVADRLAAALAVTHERKLALEQLAKARQTLVGKDLVSIHDSQTSAYHRSMLEPMLRVAIDVSATHSGNKPGMLLVAWNDPKRDAVNRMADAVRRAFPNAPLFRFADRELAVLVGSTDGLYARAKAGEIAARAQAKGLTVSCGYASMALELGPTELIAAAQAALAYGRRVGPGQHI
jgi:CheY-like chemotaxis protein